MERYSDWDLMVYVFVWCIRTSTKLVNGTYTPYEIITGMKPRSPIDAVLGMPSAVQRITSDEYVAKLVEYLRSVHGFINTRQGEVRRQEHARALRKHGARPHLRVGDYCMIRKAPLKGVSHRFQRSHHDQVFQIVDTIGIDPNEIKTYKVSDLLGRTENLGFQQPVAAENLTPVDLLPLMRPSADNRTRISLDYAGMRRTGSVVAQSHDGTVHVLFDGDEESKIIDLATTSYTWL